MAPKLPADSSALRMDSTRGSRPRILRTWARRMPRPLPWMMRSAWILTGQALADVVGQELANFVGAEGVQVQRAVDGQDHTIGGQLSVVPVVVVVVGAFVGAFIGRPAGRWLGMGARAASLQ